MEKTAMRTWRLVLGVVLVGFGIGYLSAQDRGSPGELTAQDRLDIQDLYWRYAHGQNFADADWRVQSRTLNWDEAAAD